MLLLTRKVKRKPKACQRNVKIRLGNKMFFSLGFFSNILDQHLTSDEIVSLKTWSLRPGQTINVGRPNMLGEPTFHRLATVFDDHSTCWMMLEPVWCSIKHLIQHFFCSHVGCVKFRLTGLNNMLHARTRIRTANLAVTIDTVCSRQCGLKMSASEEAAQNIDQTSSKKTPKQKARHWNDE